VVWCLRAVVPVCRGGFMRHVSASGEKRPSAAQAIGRSGTAGETLRAGLAVCVCWLLLLACFACCSLLVAALLPAGATRMQVYLQGCL